MDKRDRIEIQLIWWITMDAAEALSKLDAPIFTRMFHRIHDFQYTLWEICGKPLYPRPSPDGVDDGQTK